MSTIIKKNKFNSQNHSRLRKHKKEPMKANADKQPKLNFAVGSKI